MRYASCCIISDEAAWRPRVSTLMCVLRHVPTISLYVPSGPGQLTELFLLPWAAYFPNLPLPPRPHRHAPFTSNINPMRKGMNLERVCLCLIHLLGPIQPLRPSTQSNLISSPFLYLLHPRPTIPPKDRYPDLVDQIIRMFRAVYPGQQAGQHSIDQILRCRRTICPGRFRRVHHVIVKEMIFSPWRCPHHRLRAVAIMTEVGMARPM